MNKEDIEQRIAIIESEINVGSKKSEGKEAFIDTILPDAAFRPILSTNAIKNKSIFEALKLTIKTKTKTANQVYRQTNYSIFGNFIECMQSIPFVLCILKPEIHLGENCLKRKVYYEN